MKKLLLITALIAFKMSVSQCDIIKKDVDKFTGQARYSASYINPKDDYSHAIFTKFTSDTEDTAHCFIMFQVNSITPYSDIKGCIFLLSDGTKINKPDAKTFIKVEDDGSGYRYRAFVELYQEDINILRINKITAVRIYVFDYDFTDQEQNENMKILNCIIDSK